MRNYSERLAHRRRKEERKQSMSGAQGGLSDGEKINALKGKASSLAVQLSQLRNSADPAARWLEKERRWLLSRARNLGADPSEISPRETDPIRTDTDPVGRGLKKARRNLLSEARKLGINLPELSPRNDPMIQALQETQRRKMKGVLVPEQRTLGRSDWTETWHRESGTADRTGLVRLLNIAPLGMEIYVTGYFTKKNQREWSTRAGMYSPEQLATRILDRRMEESRRKTFY